MVLVAIGILLSTSIFQPIRFASEFEKLQSKLGVANISILDSKCSFPQNLEQHVFKSTSFILDTALNYETVSGPDDPQRRYKEILDKRIKNKEISFRRVELIFSRKRLEKVIQNLLKYEGIEYFIRIYDAPPKPIPVIHMMSFDNRHFYLGGFFPAESPTEEIVLYVQNDEIAKLLSEYWNELWRRAKPLNENKQINWDELKNIASKIGIDEVEFEQIINKIKK